VLLCYYVRLCIIFVSFLVFVCLFSHPLFVAFSRARLFKDLRTRLLALGCLDVRRDVLLERLIKNPKEGKNDSREPVVRGCFFWNEDKVSHMTLTDVLALRYSNDFVELCECD
jgi:hypothetical protein